MKKRLVGLYLTDEDGAFRLSISATAKKSTGISCPKCMVELDLSADSVPETHPPRRLAECRRCRTVYSVIA